jgi:hypothetical protein
MGRRARVPDDNRMMEQDSTEATARKQARQRTRISELRAQIDDRDETIRLLNEALSQALAELERDDRRAA